MFFDALFFPAVEGSGAHVTASHAHHYTLNPHAHRSASPSSPCSPISLSISGVSSSSQQHCVPSPPSQESHAGSFDEVTRSPSVLHSSDEITRRSSLQSSFNARSNRVESSSHTLRRREMQSSSSRVPIHVSTAMVPLSSVPTLVMDGIRLFFRQHLSELACLLLQEMVHQGFVDQMGRQIHILDKNRVLKCRELAAQTLHPTEQQMQDLVDEVFEGQPSTTLKPQQFKRVRDYFRKKRARVKGKCVQKDSTRSRGRDGRFTHEFDAESMEEEVIFSNDESDVSLDDEEAVCEFHN